jgi:hypothetical protein
MEDTLGDMLLGICGGIIRFSSPNWHLEAMRLN